MKKQEGVLGWIRDTRCLWIYDSPNNSIHRTLPTIGPLILNVVCGEHAMDKKSKSNCMTSQGLVRSLSRIPSWQAYALTAVATLGAILFVVGGLWSWFSLRAAPPAVHPSTLLMIGGGVSIALLIPVSFIIYPAKEIVSLRIRLDEAEKTAQQTGPGDAEVRTSHHQMRRNS